MKIITLIQQAEKKENLSCERKEIQFWRCYSGDWLKYVLFTATLHFISIEIPDDAQINDDLHTFSNFFNQGTNTKFDSRNIFKLTYVCVYYFYYCCCKLFAKLVVETFEWVFSKKYKYSIYVMFNALIRNNEQFDQNLHQITFFTFFFFFFRRKGINRSKVIRLLCSFCSNI